MRWLFLLFLLSACGKNGDNSPGAVRYYLEKAASSTTSNALKLEVEGGFKPNFSLDGIGFTAEVPFGVSTPFQESVSLVAETFGEVEVKLTLYQENGKPYINDTILWKSSGEIPPTPEAYFSELATADAFVYLVFPKVLERGRNTQEVWIEGDLAEAPEGSYFTIPSDDQLLVKLSEADGMKTLRIKYRNIFGAHSELVELSLEKKALGPTSCRATPVASKTASGTIRIRVEAVNAGPLFYKITGDVAMERDFSEFEESTEEWVGLSGAEGEKRLVAKIKDLAGNACPDIPLVITYDRSYVPGNVTIEGDLLWTDNPQITIKPHYDQLEGDVIEMFVSGGVLEGPTTFQWLPYDTSVPVELTPTNGTRHVIVQFRRGETPLIEVTTSLFLKPYILILESGGSYQLRPGNILSASSLTISGCVEAYAQVPYQETYPCTPSDPTPPLEVEVTYHLNDGSTVTRGASH